MSQVIEATNPQSALLSALELHTEMIAKKTAPQREAIIQIVDERLEEVGPRSIQAVDPVTGIKLGEINEHTRPEFEEIAQTVAAGVNTMFVGPSGSGKTHLAKQIATVLGLEFAFLPLTAGVSESRLVGRFVPIGEGGRFQYVPAPFVELYKNGGLFLAGEMDAADPNVLLCLNAALANGHMETPNPKEPIIERHPGFRFIAAANTWGQGANRQYVGRNQLDAATLDRFSAGKFEISYDESFEQKIGDEQVVAWVHTLRKAIAAHSIRRIASTRLIIDGTKRVRAGATLEAVKRSYFLDWSDSERRSVGA